MRARERKVFLSYSQKPIEWPVIVFKVRTVQDTPELLGFITKLLSGIYGLYVIIVLIAREERKSPGQKNVLALIAGAWCGSGHRWPGVSPSDVRILNPIPLDT